MAIHDKAYNRAKSYSKAMRKYQIDRDKSAGRWLPLYNNLHQYADNKIHCSCCLCRSKTNPKTKQGSGPKMNWSITDKKKIDSMQNQLEDIDDNME